MTPFNLPQPGLLRSPDSADPKPTRWHRFWAFPVTRIVLYLLLFAALALTTSALLAGALRLLHHRHGHDRQTIVFVGEGLAAASATLAFWIMVRFADKRPWSTAGWGGRSMGRNLLAGFAIGAAMFSAGVAVLGLLGCYHVTAVAPSVLLLAPLGLYFLVAVFEETLFRGYLFQTLEGRWGTGVALGASSILFGLAHLANPTQGATTLQHWTGPVFIALEAGLPLGAAYLLTRRWWLPIGLHWAWDYCEGPVFGCPDSGNRDPHTFLRAVLTGPRWLSGGTFGPEAGVVILLVGTAAGVLLLRAAVKRGQWQPRPRAAA